MHLRRIIIALTSFFVFNQDSKAQTIENSRIVITVDSTDNLYTRIKDLFIRANFFVKDLSIRDSLITYQTEFNGVYIIGFVAIKGNTVIITGLNGLKKMDEFGYTNSPKNFSKITYYKGNREWRRLHDIAISLGGKIKYEN